MNKEHNDPLCESCGHCEPDERTVVRPEKLTRDLTTRLNRIEGQIKGIKGMVERGTYCDDVLTQVSAVQSALSSFSKILLESHMKTCIAHRMQAGDDEVISEFIKTVGRLL